MKKKIPIGYDDYKTVVERGFYYVDKTLLIKELVDNGAQVSLFTRPRRFGKSLNLSMLRYFFEKPLDGSSNKDLFSDKKIQTAREEYLSYQEQYPVIQLSLKSGKQAEWEYALKMLQLEIIKEYTRHQYLLEGKMTELERNRYLAVMNGEATYDVWLEAIAFLSRCLESYHNKKAIILIDEYDVPLENAYYCGFYDKMISFIRSLFESAVKTNPALEFAVITGCLRISKESIFTGLNNLEMISILNERHSEHFGFTQSEVDEMLSYYGLEEKADIIKKWYDGYFFGKTEVYNPWSVINFVKALLANSNAFPIEYWSNTSSNSIVKELIVHATSEVQEELEALIRGETIEKIIHEEITYADIHDSPENLWNFLLFTGYLKVIDISMEGNKRKASLAIPNEEVRNIYRDQIINWTREIVRKKDTSTLYHAILTGDAETIQAELSPLLLHSISYMDSKEEFYHGFVLGVLMNLDGYKIKSNRESGNGRYDVTIESLDGLKNPVIIEFKKVDKRNQLIEGAEKALQQIIDNHYDEPFVEDAYDQCVHVGIGFCRKMCRVRCQVVDLPI